MSVRFFVCASVQLKKMYETPLVQLQPEGEWSADIDAIVVYSQLRPFPTSSWDWIGLYKVSKTLLYMSGGNINVKNGIRQS